MSTEPLVKAKKPLGRPRILTDLAKTQALLDSYFALCASEERAPTMSGMALHLGFESRQSLTDYAERGDEFSYCIKRALLRCETLVEQRIVDAKGNPAGPIFWLKNKGWHDKQEVEVSAVLQPIVQINVDGEGPLLTPETEKRSLPPANIANAGIVDAVVVERETVNVAGKAKKLASPNMASKRAISNPAKKARQ